MSKKERFWRRCTDVKRLKNLIPAAAESFVNCNKTERATLQICHALSARACNLSCMFLCSFSRTQHDGASPKRATRRGGLWWKTSQDQKTCCFFVADFTVALRFYTPPFDRGVLVSSSYTFVVLLFLCCFVKRAAWFSVHGATCRFR